jgi:hypothetical protein
MNLLLVISALLAMGLAPNLLNGATQSSGGPSMTPTFHRFAAVELSSRTRLMLPCIAAHPIWPSPTGSSDSQSLFFESCHPPTWCPTTADGCEPAVDHVVKNSKVHGGAKVAKLPQR